MLLRTRHLERIKRQLLHFPVAALLGPRQVGETTLARQLAATWDGPVRHFDLEDPDDQARLADPAFALRPLTGLVVLDEIQLRPDLFPLLRVLADRPEVPARFLILGSAAPELLRHTTAETLAGRDQAYFWGVHTGAELDLLIVQDRRRLGSINPNKLSSHHGGHGGHGEMHTKRRLLRPPIG